VLNCKRLFERTEPTASNKQVKRTIKIGRRKKSLSDENTHRNLRTTEYDNLETSWSIH
jgi:hypothetical protein